MKTDEGFECLVATLDFHSEFLALCLSGNEFECIAASLEWFVSDLFLSHIGKLGVGYSGSLN